MNKKKISIVAVSAVVIVSLGLGFNSIFKKANTLETDNNDTVVSDQSIETGDELNTEEAKLDKTSSYLILPYFLLLPIASIQVK